MKKFFLRNSPETIQDAKELTEDEFVELYSETPSTPEYIRKAYNEIRAKSRLQKVCKSVTFKVIQTGSKVVPFNKKS